MPDHRRIRQQKQRLGHERAERGYGETQNVPVYGLRAQNIDASTLRRSAHTPPAHTPPAHTPPAHTPPAHTPPAYDRARNRCALPRLPQRSFGSGAVIPALPRTPTVLHGC
ncbi:hypothetical protein E3O11_08790 [Cryobacterium levicorallinum]|uniref:Uncharacterized protein n=1 Tax=Cryobacterium levicorallinum TaxID=995038 RepID=A0A4R8VLK4_9MICO|nr:hypothetical protein E3O11_08790 [Cryobacterium levicorallinum]